MGRSLGRSMIDDFDIVTIRVQEEGRVISGMVGAFARFAIVFASPFKTCDEGTVNSLLVLSLESQMNPPCKGAEGRATVLTRNKEFVRPKVILFYGAEGNVETLEKRGIEAKAFVKVLDHQMYMVE